MGTNTPGSLPRVALGYEDCAAVGLRDAVVDCRDTHQVIDGFGVSGAQLNAGPMSSAYATQLFTLGAGCIGLRFFRSAIYSDGAAPDGYFADQYVIRDPLMATSKGADVIFGPWSAPAAYKDNASWTGGNLQSGHYADYAAIQVGYINDLRSRGVTVYGVEIQNEPDFGGSDGTMLMTSGAMVTYLGSNLGPAVAALSPRPKIIGPSVATWSGAWAYITAILNDGTAAPYLDIASAHQYGGVDAPQTTLPIWQTEMSYFNAFDSSITQALVMAADIDAALRTGGVKAWMYWWNNGAGTDNEGLRGQNGDGTDTKRFYALGNFSKFARPGMVRVGVTHAVSGVVASAYVDQATKNFAIVVVNSNGAATRFNFALSSLSARQCVPYETSATNNLAALAAITPSNGLFSYTLPASSVTTFAGTGR